MLKSETGDAFIPLVLILGAIALLTVSAGSLWVAASERQTAIDIKNRRAEAAMLSALEITNALIHGHVLINDSITGTWSYQAPPRSGSATAVDPNDAFVIYYPPKVPWAAPMPQWATNALTQKPEMLAGFSLGLPLQMGSQLGTGASAVSATLKPSPENATLAYQLALGTPVVELTRNREFGSEISVYVDAYPYPKSLKARVGGFCRDYNPEPINMLYRNFLGTNASKGDLPSYLYKNLYPLANNDIYEEREKVLKLVPGGDNSTVIAKRLKSGNSGLDLIKELYLMYLFYTPNDDEINYLLKELELGHTTYTKIETAMQTSPVYHFINEKNDSHYYTRDEDAGKKAGFNYSEIAFYVYGEASIPAFAPTNEMALLYSCYNASNDVHFLSMEASCQGSALPGGATLKEKLGYVYTQPLSVLNKKEPIEGFSLPLYEYTRVGAKPALLASISPFSEITSEIPDYQPTSGQAGGSNIIAYVSNNDRHLASTIALFRTFFTESNINLQMKAQAYSYNASFSGAREWNPKFKNSDALAWLSETLRSYKLYHDTEGCDAAPIPATPQCYLSGPAQVSDSATRTVVLHAFGEFTSVKLDGIEVSDPHDHSKISSAGTIETPIEAFRFPKQITNSALGVNSTAEVSMVINGKTLTSTCSLLSNPTAVKSVDLKVLPSHPHLSNVFVPNKNTASLGYSPSFSFSYVTTNFDSPSCLIVSADRSYVSENLTQKSGTALMKDGIDANTEFTLHCVDKDHSKASTSATAEIFPVPSCCLSGCSIITAGEQTTFTLSTADFADKANWDGMQFSSFPVSQSKSGGANSVSIISPGGSNSCSAPITVNPPPPLIPQSNYVPSSIPGQAGSYYTTYIQPPNLPQSGCTISCATVTPVIVKPPQKHACTIDIVHASRVDGADYFCNPEKIVQFRLYIPKLKKSAVIDILYGKGNSKISSTTYGGCKSPQPAPPPDTYTDASGTVYQLKGGKGFQGFAGGDCKLKTHKSSPLMIDLNNEGMAFTSPAEGTGFDLNGNGEKDLYSWPKDPKSAVFLAYDQNGDGIINDVNELFGNNTQGPDGKKSANGFEALRKYDHNRDGRINRKDPIFKKLRIWHAYSNNGVLLKPSVLKPLHTVGITSINLKYLERTEGLDVYGNASKQRSSVKMRDKSSRTIVDMWLVY